MDRSLREKPEAVAGQGSFKGITVLVAPLDWGLGHATRIVPLIRQLSAHNNVILCTTEINHELLTGYFPALPAERIPSYRIWYSRFLPQWLKVMFAAPALLLQVRREHNTCRLLVKKHGAKATISDNRYGFYTTGVRSVYITHQLCISVPLVGKLATLVQHQALNRFSEIWIPDYSDPSRRLSGTLSGRRNDVQFIGPQSALQDVIPATYPSFDLLLLLSGPEPQRTILEKLLTALLLDSGKKIVMVRGSRSRRGSATGNMEVIDLASGPQLRGLIEAAHTVICRSGYSTLMDLHVLGKKEMVLVPTPGQPEQEYLARHWSEQFGAVVIRQDRLKAELPLRIR